jgi:hypothetical protein
LEAALLLVVLAEAREEEAHPLVDLVVVLVVEVVQEEVGNK